VLKIKDGSQQTGSSNISETMTRIIKIPTATTMFSASSFLVVAFPISCEDDVCQKSSMAAKLPEVVITSLFYRYACCSKTNTGIYDYVRNICMSKNHDRRYLVSKIQDGSQLTGSSNISETMTHQNSNGYQYVFGDSRSSNGTSDIVRRRCVLEVQDGGQITEVPITLSVVGRCRNRSGSVSSRWA